MFEPLIWMFKIPEFKKHFAYLFLMGLIFLAIAMLIPCVDVFIKQDGNIYYNSIISLVQLIFLLIPILCFTGYFWALADSIINRDDDVIASNIYNGRIKTVKKISLPELKFLNFVWRGIASIFATILLCLPCYLIYSKIIVNLQEVSQFWQWGNNIQVFYVLFLIIFVSVFIPALLWNYARRNSVIAVLNIPKAVYIMGTYTGKYVLNTFLFFLLSVIYAIIINEIITITGVHVDFSISTNRVLRYAISGDKIFLVSALLNMINYIISIYWIFVNSYLLGTIAPTSEA